MDSTITDAARAAYEPVREREQTHQEKIQAERKTRAEGHFAHVFGVAQKATVEDGQIVFTIEKSHRIAYVGNLTQKREMCGPGWVYLERCAGCGFEQGVVYIQTLADFGKILVNGTPVWECNRCNATPTAPVAPTRGGRGILRR